MSSATQLKKAKQAAFLTLAAAVIALPTYATSPEVASDWHPAGAVAGALIGGTLGFFGGGLLGSAGDCYEICGGLVFGALGGQALGVPLGAHLGNGGRGDLTVSLGLSVLAVGVGIVGTHATSSGHVYLAATVAQIAAVSTAEMRTSSNASLSVGPRLVGEDVGVGFTLRW